MSTILPSIDIEPLEITPLRGPMAQNFNQEFKDSEEMAFDQLNELSG